MTAAQGERTIFASRRGGPLSPYNVRRTFRDFLRLAGLTDSGISLRWYRRTGATVVARGMGSDAAAAFLGHTLTAITEGHYIQPDRTVDVTPAVHLERTLRPVQPDGSLLANRPADREDALLAAVDREGLARSSWLRVTLNHGWVNPPFPVSVGPVAAQAFSRPTSSRSARPRPWSRSWQPARASRNRCGHWRWKAWRSGGCPTSSTAPSWCSRPAPRRPPPRSGGCCADRARPRVDDSSPGAMSWVIVAYFAGPFFADHRTQVHGGASRSQNNSESRDWSTVSSSKSSLRAAHCGSPMVPACEPAERRRFPERSGRKWSRSSTAGENHPGGLRVRRRSTSTPPPRSTGVWPPSRGPHGHEANATLSGLHPS